MSEAWKDDPRFANSPNPASIRLWIIMGLAFVSTFFVIRSFSARPAGGRADYAWKVTDLSGNPQTLEKYAGKPIFLNVWATWCGPCMQEMPSIAALSKNPKLKDVTFLCISTDDSIEPVKGYVARTTPPMTILHAADGPPRVFRTDGIPATFIIAPDGRIVRAEVGSQDWDTPEVIALLEGLGKK